jgi:hypothetical protein
MGLDFTDMLVPSKSPFYSIAPGNAAHPLGMVVLLVTFGTRENYHTEFVKFEIANFESSYHAILGRPALAKFMAVPLYGCATPYHFYLGLTFRNSKDRALFKNFGLNSNFSKFLSLVR